MVKSYVSGNNCMFHSSMRCKKGSALLNFIESIWPETLFIILSTAISLPSSSNSICIKEVIGGKTSREKYVMIVVNIPGWK